jgi:hypothetical protein
VAWIVAEVELVMAGILDAARQKSKNLENYPLNTHLASVFIA